MSSQAERAEQSRRNSEVLLAGFKGRYDAGDKLALMQTMSWCTSQGVPVPDWAVSAFCAAVHSVETLECTSWDVAFGRPHGRSKIDARRKQNKLQWDVWLHYHGCRRAGMSAEDSRRTVAIEWKLSGATVKRYVEDIDQCFPKPVQESP